MRPRKYRPSERICLPNSVLSTNNSVLSTNISILDATVVKFSKTSRTGGIKLARTGVTGRRRSYRGEPGDQLTIGPILRKALLAGKRYQAKHDELIASKEDLLSSNRQLTALNDKLREALERQKEAAEALEYARTQADIANASKSCFLATASQDLRQPLQTLVLLQGLLAKTAVDEKARSLIGRLDQTLGSMSAMLNTLLDMIERLVPASVSSGSPLASPADPASATAPIVFIVDDDFTVRLAIRSVLEEDGWLVEDYEDGESFLDAYHPGCNACLLIDVNLPGMNGLELLNRLKDAGHPVPVIMMTGHSNVPMAVEAMKAGASDFLEKPVRRAELLAGVRHALESSRDSGKLMKCRKEAADHLAGLTQRQHQIMEMVLAGYPSKIIAADLRISQRTVENHRASIMKKAGVRSLPALARLALAATGVLATDQSLTTMAEALSS